MMTFISSPPIRWSMSVLWAGCVLFAFIALGVSSLASWSALIVTGILPPTVFLLLWNDGPPPTIAEVLHDTETPR